jgi:nucleotide-binding universal stress UspA family protein
MLYKRIVVAIDECETSKVALSQAINLSKTLQAKLCIVNVVEEFPMEFSELMFIEECKKVAKEYGCSILKVAEVNAKNENISYETHLIEASNTVDSIAQKIIQFVKVWDAELLILGTHGRRGFHRLFLGSVAEEASRISNTPLLLIRTGKNFSKNK